MSSVKTSLLPALVDYYQRLEADPDADVAPFGFSRQKIAFGVVIEPDGSLHAIQDLRRTDSGRDVPTSMIVPGQSKASGSGINPCFLWDNPAYMLGYRREDPKPERTRQSFEAFRDQHLALRREIDDPAFAAVCRFLEKWKAEDAARIEALAQVGAGFGVFRLRNARSYVHECRPVLEYWRKQLTAGGSEAELVGMSLVTGQIEPLARLHEPKIKGVAGSQSSGAVIVGFNDDAYESYGKTQSYNAPVGVQDAFRYTTALNRLLAESARRVRIGDATVVFWSDRKTEAEDWFLNILDESAEDRATVERVGAFLRAARQGRLTEDLRDPSAAFYVLGLSPNVSRLNVRFWLVGTVGEFVDRLAQHIADLEMIGSRDDRPPLMIRGLVSEAMPEGTGPSRERQVAQMAGELARAVLVGSAYPQVLLAGIVRRVRADQQMNHRRAAALKACIVRNARLAGRNVEILMSLNKDHPDSAYQMGRLFAAIEKTQEEALPGLNKTVRNGYFGTASATPATVFPRLIRLHQHHIEKLEGGMKVVRERLVQEICSRIDRFPAHLALERQGVFHIGYYHQRQDFFTSRKDGQAADDGQRHQTQERPT